MKAPLISIIVPAYNCRDYISKCIESILQQNEADFELILINDGSSDGTDLICKKYASDDSRIKYLEQENQGVATARNYGLSVANGRYVTFSDGDDWLEHNAFSICLDILSKSNADMVKFGYYIEKDNGTTDKCNIDKPRIFNSMAGLLKYTDSIEYHAFVWNMFMKKEVIQGLHFNQEINWLEDQIFGYQCFMACKRIIYIPNCLYHYRYWDKGSLSSVQSPKVIALASQLEYKIKKRLTQEDSYQDNINDEYRWRLEFLVDTLYSIKSKYRYRKEIRQSIKPLYPLKLREGRMFFNITRPFVINDLLLRLLFKLKNMIHNTKRTTRI